MNILISTIWSMRPGGVSSHVKALKLALERLGHTVDVVFPDYAESDNLITFYENARHSLARKIESIMRNKKYDVINAQDVMSYLSCWFLNTDIPEVLTVHGYMADEAVASNSIKQGSPEDKYFRYCEELSYQNASQIITTDNNIYTYIKRITGKVKNNITVLNNIVDTELFMPMKKNIQFKVMLGIPKDAFTVLCPRRLTAVNGVNYLIDAFKILQDKNINLFLLIAGDGDERKKIIKHASDIGVGKNLLMLGSVNHSKMPELYSVCDAVCVPSVTLGEFKDTAPISAMEAMMCGKVVVASDVDCFKNIIQDGVNGIIVREKDAASLSRGILRAMSSEKCSIEKNAYITALNKFSSITAARIYTRIFLRAVNEIKNI